MVHAVLGYSLTDSSVIISRILAIPFCEATMSRPKSAAI